MSPNFEYIAVVLDDYCDMQTSGFIPTANRYPVADVQEQVALLGQLEPAGNAVLANRIAELEREVSMRRSAEITWEKTMMQAVGEDGPKSVVEAIDKIKAERDALAAQVEVLKDWRRLALQFDGHRMQAMSMLKMVASGNFDMEEVRQFIAAAPVSGEQHLAEIRAEAGLAGFVACHELDKIVPVNDESVQALADRYADQIRQGGAE